MYKKIHKFPGGMLLVPMLISALINTISPNLLHMGGVTEGFLTTNGINYAIGATLFFSGVSLNLRSIVSVLKKQGLIILVKTVICLILVFLYLKLFGQAGVLGISTLAFVSALCSTNPALYLSMVSDYGEEDDKKAFCLVSLVCIPAYALLIFGISQTTPIDWTPIISALIPLFLGVIVGSLDVDFKKFFASGVAIMMPLLGWCFGAGINLVDALKAGPQGILLTLIFYVAILPITFVFERKILKSDGLSSMAMASIAGMSASVPQIIASSNPALQPYVSSAVAQIAMGVVLTSIVTPLLIKRLEKGKPMNEE